MRMQSRAKTQSCARPKHVSLQRTSTRPAAAGSGPAITGCAAARCCSRRRRDKLRTGRLTRAHNAQEEEGWQERRPPTPALQDQPSPSRARAQQGQLAREAADAAQQMHGTRSAEAAGSAQKRAALAASRRRVAAEWVEELTGEALPTASDHAFRAALRDGVLLCRVLNTLRPGYISRVRGLERGAAGAATRPPGDGRLPSCSIEACCRCCSSLAVASRSAELCELTLGAVARHGGPGRKLGRGLRARREKPAAQCAVCCARRVPASRRAGCAGHRAGACGERHGQRDPDDGEHHQLHPRAPRAAVPPVRHLLRAGH